MPTIEEIEKAYSLLETARKDLFTASEDVILAEDALKNAENQVIIAGLDGANETARKTFLAQKTKVESSNLSQAERQKREAALIFELIGLKIKCYRDVLRILELNKEGVRL